MATNLTVHATEKSTYIVTAAFQNELGVAVTPNSVTWTLTNVRGVVIGSLENVNITPATSIKIVLTGDDLMIGSYGGKRIITIKAVYDSINGSGLLLKGCAMFDIDNLVVVA
jgi:hypothetical protein